jgi:hypothetical protein
MLVKNIGRIILLATGIILLLSANVFAVSTCNIMWGQGYISVSCRNQEGRTTVDLDLICGNCHSYKTQTEAQARLMKYTYPIRLRHHLEYFPKAVFVVEEGKKYPLDAQKYITREKSLIVLVDGTGKYKYIFEPHAIVLKDKQGRPIAIESLCDFQKVPLAPVSTTSPPVGVPLERR